MNSNITRLTDLVCNMEVHSDDISLDYQGKHYVFCSNQCLERFQANPHLYIGYPGSKSPKHAGKEIIKTRTLKLAEPLPQEVANRVIDYIENMMGTHYVEINEDRIDITYDFLQATESQIEATIVDAGAVLDDNWTEKLRRILVQFTEDTEATTLEAKPPSARRHHH